MLKIFNDSLDKWNSIVSSFDYYDYYSLYEWGELRKKNNWQILRIINIENNKTSKKIEKRFKKINVKSISQRKFLKKLFYRLKNTLRKVIYFKLS